MCLLEHRSGLCITYAFRNLHGKHSLGQHAACDIPSITRMQGHQTCAESQRRADNQQ